MIDETKSESQSPLAQLAGDVAPEAEDAVVSAVALDTAEASADALTATTADVAEAEAELETETAKSKWYAIHAYSGMEQKVLKNVQYRLEIDGLSRYVKHLLVPTHTVIEIKDGKKHQMQRNLMPGYVLIEVQCKEDTFKEIVETVSKLGGVAGFVGDGTDPIALGDDEVEGLLAQTTHRQDKPKTEIQFTRGQVVKIIEGAFAGFSGTVDEIDPQRGKLSVMVSIFGRPTAVELDVLQVDRS